MTELETERFVARRIPNRIRGLQLAAALVEQVDRKCLERDQPADEDRDLRQEIVEIEDRGDLAAQVEQRPDDLVLDGCRCGQLVGCRRRGIVFFCWGISVTHWVKGPRLLVLALFERLELYLQVPAALAPDR